MSLLVLLRSTAGSPPALGTATTPTIVVEAELAGAGSGWTDLTSDVLWTPQITIRTGMQGGGHSDRVAATGTGSFALNNSPLNSAGLIGRYSPFHANKRSGWGLGIGCRIRLINPNTGTSYTKITGRIDAIEPRPGINGDLSVVVTVVDWMDEAARWTLTPAIGEQVGKTGDQILAAILAQMPRQPAATNFDSTAEAYTYALDTSSNSQQPALAEFVKLAASEYGLIYLKGDGTLRQEGRHARILDTTTDWTITDADLINLTMVSDRNDIINTVRVTAHPKQVDETADTIVYNQTNPIAIAAGETKLLMGSFRDPITGDEIGATDVQPLLSGSDYVANVASDETGVDLTADVSIVPTVGQAGARFLVTNNGAVDGYLTVLQARGRGIYDRGTVQKEATDATSITTNGERVVVFDMPYQENDDVTQGAADYILAKYKTAGAQVQAVTVIGDTATLMGQIVARDISDRLTISETVTGLNDSFFINGMELQLAPTHVQATYILAPAQDPFSGLYWILDTSVLGTDTLPAPF